MTFTNSLEVPGGGGQLHHPSVPPSALLVLLLAPAAPPPSPWTPHAPIELGTPPSAPPPETPPVTTHWGSPWAPLLHLPWVPPRPPSSHRSSSTPRAPEVLAPRRSSLPAPEARPFVPLAPLAPHGPPRHGLGHPEGVGPREGVQALRKATRLQLVE